ELEAREPLVVADFQALSGDSTLAVVVTEGLRADLAQSSFVTVADRGRVRETLDRMLRPPGTRLDPGTAREVALRMGLKAVVEGEIGRAGTGYLLTARVVTADSAVTLAAFRETAVDSTGLLAAIEGLSRSLRERVGESLGAVRASAPLARVTTPSLPALRRFAEGSAEEQAGNRSRAIRLLDDAVDLDPGFATAWHSLAILHYNSNAREATLRAMERALEHQDRLDDPRRHRARAFYAAITGDHRAAELEERELLTLTPDDPVPHINLSDMAWNRGDWAEAEGHARRALELGSESWVAHWNLVVALLDAGKVEDARWAAEEARRTLPGDLDIQRQLIDMSLAAGSRYDSIRRHAATPPVRRAHAGRVLGRWDEAEALLRSSADAGGQARWWRYWDRMVVMGDPDATDAIEEAIDTVIGVVEDFPERPIAEVALAMAMAGRPDAARKARVRYEERVPEPVRWADAYLLHAIDGFLALDEGRLEDAFSALRRSRESTPWTAPVDAFVGRAYDLAGRPDSAIAAYERYLHTPWAYRIGFFHSFADPVLLVPVHERLAYLYEELGDRTAAAGHAPAVLTLWDG
ncbi:MAG: tetratricopeptide repeat protein, partial [Gemmatimonadetes bacterium]|nr:tetratricopeptide repeat protein [Gemmatimonadota bacterium]NIQ52711.1 tetratricopeptide repeat protein [Gemmatimonadota bacterium]NIU72851.1 tetratricopeptide repeat protein [Gammaproteobacteria bacterium]NIX43217.1 tetratricopeptide repeat protein [Gemmatimonadota bacterium]NIY12381.1 tetratricopeptide repeat protein [Gemmatimonadota bacterium]